MLQSINPFTNEIIQTHSLDDPKAINDKIETVYRNQKLWKSYTFKERSKVLSSIANTLLIEKESFAQLITEEMGKPIKESILEIEKCASVCLYYATHAEDFLAPRTIQTDTKKNILLYQPLGVILAIMPWNFPFWQFFRCFAPTIMAGNTLLLKHASNVQRVAHRIIQMVNNHVDERITENVVLPGNQVDTLIRDNRIHGVTLTGSEQAGISVATTAGSAMKKSLFELGGIDPFIVLSDANIEAAVDSAIMGRFLNAGQSCIAAKRFIIVKDVYDEFSHLFLEKVKQLNCGNPMEHSTDIGPLAKKEFALELQSHVNQTIVEGGSLLYGGSHNNNIFTPTILTNLTRDSIPNKVELFGPIAALFKVDSEQHALTLANSTSYGLSSSLWTSDLQRAESLASRIDAGAVFINQFSKSDPRLPFGGIKLSGYGRELGEDGIKEFINIKTVSIN